MIVNQTYNINMTPGSVPVRVPTSQNDAGGSRLLVFKLYYGEEGNGRPLIIPDNSVVTVDGTKPDGNDFSYTASYSGQTVTIGIRKQMTAVAGDVLCQLTITNGGEIIGSANFILVVERTTLRLTNVSQTDMASFTELAQMASTGAAQAIDAADRAVAAADFLSTANGVSLNTLVHSGLYYCTNTCTDRPDDEMTLPVHTWMVQVIASQDGSLVKQVARAAIFEGYEFERHYYASEGTWSAWTAVNITHDDVIIVTASFGANYTLGDDSITVNSFNQRCKSRIEANGDRKCHLAWKIGGGFVNNGFRDALQAIESSIDRPDKVGLVLVCGGGNDVNSEYSRSDVGDGISRFMTYAAASYPNAVFRFAWLSWRQTYNSSKPAEMYNETIGWMQDLCPVYGISYCGNSEWMYHQYYSSWTLSDHYHPSDLGSRYLADRIMDCINNGSTHVNRVEEIAENSFFHRTSNYEESNPVREQCGFIIRQINGATTITPQAEPLIPTFKINYAVGHIPTAMGETTTISPTFTFSSNLVKSLVPKEQCPKFPITIVAVGETTTTVDGAISRTVNQATFPGWGMLHGGYAHFGAVRPSGFDPSLYSELWFYLPTITIPTSYA